MITVEQLKEQLDEWPNDLLIAIEVKNQQGFAASVDYMVNLDGTNRRIVITDYEG